MKLKMLRTFSDAMQFHKVRERKFTFDEMARYKIRGIFNMVGGLDHMGPDVVRGFCIGCTRTMTPEIAIIEASIKDTGKGNPLKVVSVMVFRDRFAYGLFVIREGVRQARYLDSNGFAEPVLGLLN